MKIVLPKDEVVAALSAENKLLKKQIAALKAQITKSENKSVDSKAELKNYLVSIGRFKEFRAKFNDLLLEYSDLHWLREDYGDGL